MLKKGIKQNLILSLLVLHSRNALPPKSSQSQNPAFLSSQVIFPFSFSAAKESAISFAFAASASASFISPSLVSLLSIDPL